MLTQEYPLELIEIIIIDDGSTDNTRQVLDPLLSGGRVHYHYQENAGKAAATAKGIELAQGEIVFNLDADDWFLPNKIKHTVNMFLNNPGLVHIATPALIHWEDGSRPDEREPVPVKLLGKPTHGQHLLHYFFDHNLLFGGGSTFSAKASVLKQMHWTASVDMYTDEWLLIETLLQGHCYLLPQPLSVWRIHGGNYSGATNAGKIREKQERLEKASAAILQLIEQGDYPEWLKKAYRLKHEVRKMVWLEESNEKSTLDIVKFLSKGIFGGNRISVLKKYHAFNRLVPGPLMRWGKRLKR